MHRFKLLLLVIALVSLVGCNVDSSSKTTESNEDGRSYFTEEEEEEKLPPLHEELIIEGVKLYQTVDDVEAALGEPTQVKDEEHNVYTYTYEDIGVEFVFDGTNDILKAIGIEGSSVKTKKGMGIGDTFSDIVDQYFMYDAYFFKEQAVIAQDETTILTFTMNPDNEAVFYLLSNKSFFETSAEMTTEEFIEDLDREYRARMESVGEGSTEEEWSEVPEEDTISRNESDLEDIENSFEELQTEPITGNMNDALYFHVTNGNTGEVKNLLNQYDFELDTLFSPSAHPSPYFQTTFIHEAAYYGDLEMVKMMVEYGANPEVKDPDGNTVLITALIKNKTDIANYLLDLGADPSYLVYDQSDRNMSYSYTPLMVAAKNGNIELMERLLFMGVDIDQQSIVGETALMFAVNHNQLAAAKWLINNGADPYIEENTYHYTIFEFPAQEWGISAEMVEWINTIK